MDPNHNSNQQEYVEEDEFDLIALAKTLWNERKTVLKTTLIFMVIGLFIAKVFIERFLKNGILLPQKTVSIKLYTF